MNKIYKVVWNRAKHCYTVASELAKGVTKGASTGRSVRAAAAAVAVAALFTAMPFGATTSYASFDAQPVSNRSVVRGNDQVITGTDQDARNLNSVVSAVQNAQNNGGIAT